MRLTATALAIVTATTLTGCVFVGAIVGDRMRQEVPADTAPLVLGAPLTAILHNGAVLSGELSSVETDTLYLRMDFDECDTMCRVTSSGAVAPLSLADVQSFRVKNARAKRRLMIVGGLIDMAIGAYLVFSNLRLPFGDSLCSEDRPCPLSSDILSER